LTDALEPTRRRELADLVARAALYSIERRYLDRPEWGRARLLPTLPLDWALDARFLQLERLGLSASDGKTGAALLRHGMQSMLSAMHSTDGALIFTLGSDGDTHQLHMGIRTENAGVHIGGLAGGLAGHLPGSRWKQLSRTEAQQAIAQPIAEWEHLAALTGVPAFKLDDQSGQSLERLIESLSGQPYQLMVIAEPIPPEELRALIERARGLASELHPLVKQDVNESRSTTRSESTGKSEERNESTSKGKGGTRGESSQTVAASAGSGLSMAVALAGMAAGLGAAALLVGQIVGEGAAAITGRRSRNSGDNWNTNTSTGRGSSESSSSGTSDSESRAMSGELLNKSAEAAEKLLDRLVERMELGQGLGFWNVGVYIAAPDAATLTQAQAHLRALASGRDNFEAIRAVNLSDAPPVTRKALLALHNPALQFPEAQHPLGKLYQSMGTPINTEELSLWMNLPAREVSGLQTSPVVHFGINPPRVTAANALPLGEVLGANGGTGRTLRTTPEKLARHAFITGTTGSGKTNTTLQLLRGLVRQGIPFLVIEPAKTEYRALLADPEIRPYLQIFTLGNESISPFRLNPFEWVSGFGLLTHIDLLKATFNAAFPMYASMPYLLEEAILDCYTLRGWNLATGQNSNIRNEDDDPARWLPSLSDLYQQIDQVVERKQYAQQLRMDLSAALKARISSLRVGSKGLMLDVQRSIPIAELLARPTILELQDLGDDAEKAFVMGLLLTLLYEHRQVHGGDGLQHLTVIEEAHRLLKRVGTSDNPEIANPQGRAVETFGNILAEVREYGEGIIVVDQIASKIAPDVIKNTNLKIIHRVMARDDREEVGGAVALDEAQKSRLVTLRPGEAVIHDDEMDQAMLVRVDHARGALRRGSSIKAAEVRDHMQTAHDLSPYYEQSWPAAPLIERIGCATCRARCRYGARVAKAINPKAMLPMLAKLDNLRDDAGNVRLAALDEVLQKQAAALTIPGDNAHDLKHCILTHYTDDESVLQRHSDFVLE
jgi:DNA helicase HerA-like ATPase